jgi:hypothetical protein
VQAVQNPTLKSSKQNNLSSVEPTAAATGNNDHVHLPSMDDLIGLCKRRGFIFPSSELYNGINGFFDYGKTRERGEREKKKKKKKTKNII